MSNIAVDLINNPVWDKEMIHTADLIFRISNIAYNNTSSNLLPLDDGVYDQLAVLYYKYNPNYQVGAAPIVFNEQPLNEIVNEQKVMCAAVDDMDKKLYMNDIWRQNVPLREMRPVNMCFLVKDPISKRLINTEHKYPELVGTLDKCKFVLNNDAIAVGVFDKPSVKICTTDTRSATTPQISQDRQKKTAARCSEKLTKTHFSALQRCSPHSRSAEFLPQTFLR